MPLSSKIFLYASPLLLLVLVESFLYRRIRNSNYAWNESLASVGVAVGFFVTGALTIGLSITALNWIWTHRLFTIPLDVWWAYVLLFFGVEFCYYWQHRVMHEMRWFWATHAVHHSPQHLNLSAAYRLGWTGRISGVLVFYVPLVWLGFTPTAILATLALNLLYQFWLHTELIPKLGWFEKIFNTPSHHRVHHAVNVDYLDRNYGGVLILFDRWFGTFAEERADEPCRYGLVKQLESNNPFVIAFHEWIAMLRDVARSGSLRAGFGHLFGPPGWQPDGKGMTTENLRRASLSANPSVEPLANPQASLNQSRASASK